MLDLNNFLIEYIAKVILTILLIGAYSKTYSQNNKDSLLFKAEQYYEKGVNLKYKEKDSSLFYFDKSYEIFKKQENWLFCIYLIQQLNSTSSWHYDLKKLDFYIKRGDTIFEYQNSYFDSIPEGRKVIHHHQVDKINYWKKLRSYDRVKELAIDLRNSISKIPDSLRTIEEKKYFSVALEYEALAYKFWGEYTKAEKLYNLSLNYTLQEIGTDFAQQTYTLLGDLYIEQGRYKSALSFIQRSLKKEISTGEESKNRVVTKCYTIANNYLKWYQKNKASSLLDSAKYYLSISHNNLKNPDPLLYRYHYILGKIQFLNKEYEKALISLDTTLHFLRQDSTKSKNLEIARVHRLKGDIKQESNNVMQSLTHYKNAIMLLSENFEPRDVLQNPALKEVNYKYEYLKVLNQKIIALEKSKKLPSALSTVEAAVEVIDNIKSSFWNEEDKQFLIENFYPVFESGINITYNLYKKTGEQSFIDKAFYLSEKGKNVVLLEALLNAKAYRFSNLPKYVYEKEYQLNDKIKTLKRKKQLADENSELIALDEELLENEENYKNFIKEIELKFPRYYNLKYDDQVISIKEFQKTLNKNDMALSYFYDEEYIYIIPISKDQKDFKQIPIQKGFEKQLQKLITSLQNPKYDLTTLNKESYSIYQSLIKSIRNVENVENLIIIPDGILNYIPFESLYTGKKYLIEKSKITYANSATLLQKLKPKKENNKQVLVFAPSFFSGKYVNLPHSSKEVKEILSFLNGKLYEGDNATVGSFVKESPFFDIIHLTTHSILDDNYPERSQLVFTKNKEIDSLLTKDIYNLDLNASLVCLNACETGIGQFKKGEGMLSISRAFFYAGASSILSTKWKVSDKSSSDIVISFYKYLSKGKKKHTALQLAKTDFIKKYSDTDYIHPYWWSGITLNGSTESIAKKDSVMNWFWIVLLLSLILFLYIRKIKFR
ncbi:CHAT domain-containing protein [Aquimarina sp. AD10]|uniref:CHAT domain-containing protein n=1 Tax=Aquimarina sp. AD10 TaxID=1714849 RepID=UPI000E5435E5|nr:CHAT domain-containing tetratricopeptide repeat protein [Aquimarina sp. AD10]AXT62115.1 CHAT domain-containing protein [Aquimarina sp. AD10]